MSLISFGRDSLTTYTTQQAVLSRLPPKRHFDSAMRLWASPPSHFESLCWNTFLAAGFTFVLTKRKRNKRAASFWVVNRKSQCGAGMWS